MKRSAGMAMLALGAAVVLGCATNPEMVERLEHKPAEVSDEERAGVGLAVFSGKPHGNDFAMNHADTDARQVVAKGLLGVPFRYTQPAVGDEESIEVKVRNVSVERSSTTLRDVLVADEGHRYRMVSHVRAPVSRNVDETTLERFRSGTAYQAIVRSNLRDLDGHVRARWRAIRMAIEEHFAERQGTHTGTIFLLTFEPQIILPPEAEQVPDTGNRFMREVRVRNAAGGHHLDFDVRLVIAEHDWTQPQDPPEEEVDEVLEELYELTGEDAGE